MPRRPPHPDRRPPRRTAAPGALLLGVLVLGALLTLAAPAAAQEGPRVALRTGSHADHGRLVFDWPAPVPYTAEARDNEVLLRFDAPGRIDLAAARRPPRNVLAVEQAGSAVLVRLAPGAQARHFRLGNRIVLDLRDAPAAGAARAAPAAATAAQTKAATTPEADNAAPADILRASGPAAPVAPPARAEDPPQRLCTARFVANDPLPLDRFFVGLLTGDGCTAGDVLHFTFAGEGLAASVAARHCRFDGPVLLDRGEQTHLVCIWLGTMRTGR